MFLDKQFFSFMTGADAIELELKGDGDEADGRRPLSNKWMLVQVESK